MRKYKLIFMHPEYRDVRSLMSAEDRDGEPDEHENDGNWKKFWDYCLEKHQEPHLYVIQYDEYQGKVDVSIKPLIDFINWVFSWPTK